VMYVYLRISARPLREAARQREREDPRGPRGGGSIVRQLCACASLTEEIPLSREGQECTPNSRRNGRSDAGGSPRERAGPDCGGKGGGGGGPRDAVSRLLTITIDLALFRSPARRIIQIHSNRCRARASRRRALARVSIEGPSVPWDLLICMRVSRAERDPPVDATIRSRPLSARIWQKRVPAEVPAATGHIEAHFISL